MAKEREDDSEVSPEAQLQEFQQKVNSLKTTSLVLGALSFILLIVIAGLTIIVIDKPKVEYATTEQIDAISQAMELQTANIGKIDAQIELINRDKQLRQAGSSESSVKVQRDLVKIIQLMQNSMRDQSRMIPGSRSWYEHYNSQLEGIETALKKKISAAGVTPPTTSSKSGLNDDGFSDSPF